MELEGGQQQQQPRRLLVVQGSQVIEWPNLNGPHPVTHRNGEIRMDLTNMRPIENNRPQPNWPVARCINNVVPPKVTIVKFTRFIFFVFNQIILQALGIKYIFKYPLSNQSSSGNFKLPAVNNLAPILTE